MERNNLERNIKPIYEKCPDCGADVVLRFSGDSRHEMLLFDPNGSAHVCESDGNTPGDYEKHPIGQAVVDRTITEFHLRGRRLTIHLDDGNELTVSAAGRPLSIRLSGPAGMLQE